MPIGLDHLLGLKANSREFIAIAAALVLTTAIGGTLAVKRFNTRAGDRDLYRALIGERLNMHAFLFKWDDPVLNKMKIGVAALTLWSVFLALSVLMPVLGQLQK
jgi:hypothetical protein